MGTRYVFSLVVANCAAALLALGAQASEGFKIESDVDFVLVIDGVASNIIGTATKPVVLPLAPGSYNLTVVSVDGDMWQGQITAPNTMKVSLIEARRARLARIQAVEETKRQLQSKSSELVNIQERIKALSSDPDFVERIRRRIANELIEYNSLFGYYTVEQASLRNHADSLLMENLGRDDTVGLIGNGVGWLQRLRAKKLDHRIAAYKRTLARLGEALEDPLTALKHGGEDYTKVSHAATLAKVPGELVLTRGLLAFVPKADGKRLEFPCSEILGVGNGKKTFTIKTVSKKFEFRVGQWQDSEYMFGDTYLSCPKLAQ